MRPSKSFWMVTTGRISGEPRDTITISSAPSRSRPTRTGWRSARTRSAGASIELRFKNLHHRGILPDTIDDVEADVAWANDNGTVLYVEKDPETLLGLYVKKHRLGPGPELDALVFAQTDKCFYTGVSKSKSDRFIFIHMESTLSSEWRYADADRPVAVVQCFSAARARP